MKTITKRDKLFDHDTLYAVFVGGVLGTTLAVITTVLALPEYIVWLAQ